MESGRLLEVMHHGASLEAWSCKGVYASRIAASSDSDSPNVETSGRGVGTVPASGVQYLYMVTRNALKFK